jgi:hypothetical protein
MHLAAEKVLLLNPSPFQEAERLVSRFQICLINDGDGLHGQVPPHLQQQCFPTAQIHLRPHYYQPEKSCTFTNSTSIPSTYHVACLQFDPRCTSHCSFLTMITPSPRKVRFDCFHDVCAFGPVLCLLISARHSYLWISQQRIYLWEPCRTKEHRLAMSAFLQLDSILCGGQASWQARRSPSTARDL